MADKTVRLTNAAGVVVTTSAENAERLEGFQPAQESTKTAAKKATSKSDK